MKVQVKINFKSYFFCHQQNNKKNRQALHKIFFKPNAGVQRCLYPLFQNERPHVLLPFLFQRISQPTGQDQQNGKRKYC